MLLTPPGLEKLEDLLIWLRLPCLQRCSGGVQRHAREQHLDLVSLRQHRRGAAGLQLFPALVPVAQLGEELLPPPAAWLLRLRLRLRRPRAFRQRRLGHQLADAGSPENPRLPAGADDRGNQQEDRRRQQPPAVAVVAEVAQRRGEGVHGDRDQDRGVPDPEHRVFHVVGGALLPPAQVDKEERCPQGLRRQGPPLLGPAVVVVEAADPPAGGLAIQEGGERVDRQDVGADARQPDACSEPALDGVVAQGDDQHEETLEAQAAEDEDAQLPLVPPLHSTPDVTHLSQTK